MPLDATCFKDNNNNSLNQEKDMKLQPKIVSNIESKKKILKKMHIFNLIQLNFMI